MVKNSRSYQQDKNLNNNNYGQVLIWDFQGKTKKPLKTRVASPQVEFNKHLK